MNYHEAPDGSIDIMYYTKAMADLLPGATAKKISEDIDDPLLAFWMGVGFALTWVSLYAEKGDPRILAQLSESYNRLTIWMGQHGYHKAIAYHPKPTGKEAPTDE